MEKIAVNILRTINKGIRGLFPKAFLIERKFPGGFPKTIDTTQALQILNLPKDSSQDEIAK